MPDKRSISLHGYGQHSETLGPQLAKFPCKTTRDPLPPPAAHVAKNANGLLPQPSSIIRANYTFPLPFSQRLILQVSSLLLLPHQAQHPVSSCTTSATTINSPSQLFLYQTANTSLPSACPCLCGRTSSSPTTVRTCCSALPEATTISSTRSRVTSS